MTGIVLLANALLGVIQTGQFIGQEGDLVSLLQLGTSVFSLLLFALSLYAWARRRQPALVLVSIAFLIFFLKIIISLSPQVGNQLELVLVLSDFLILALFFLAIVIRPSRKHGRTNEGLN